MAFFRGAQLSFVEYASWAVMIKNSDYDSNLPTASYSDLWSAQRFVYRFKFARQ